MFDMPAKNAMYPLFATAQEWSKQMLLYQGYGGLKDGRQSRIWWTQCICYSSNPTQIYIYPIFYWHFLPCVLGRIGKESV